MSIVTSPVPLNFFFFVEEKTALATLLQLSPLSNSQLIILLWMIITWMDYSLSDLENKFDGKGKEIDRGELSETNCHFLPHLVWHTRKKIICSLINWKNCPPVNCAFFVGFSHFLWKKKKNWISLGIKKKLSNVKLSFFDPVDWFSWFEKKNKIVNRRPIGRNEKSQKINQIRSNWKEDHWHPVRS